MSALDHFIQQRNTLKQEVEQLMTLRNHVFNAHTFTADTVALRAMRWTPSRKLIEAICEDIKEAEDKVRKELADHEAKITFQE